MVGWGAGWIMDARLWLGNRVWGLMKRATSTPPPPPPPSVKAPGGSPPFAQTCHVASPHKLCRHRLQESVVCIVELFCTCFCVVALPGANLLTLSLSLALALSLSHYIEKILLFHIHLTQIDQQGQHMFVRAIYSYVSNYIYFATFSFSSLSCSFFCDTLLPQCDILLLTKSMEKNLMFSKNMSSPSLVFEMVTQPLSAR